MTTAPDPEGPEETGPEEPGPEEPGREEPGPVRHHIIVGVDGSDTSIAALELALREAETKGGDVTALLAWQVPFLSFPGGFDRDQLENAAKKYLVEVVSAVVPSPKVPLWTIVAEGEPTECLIEASKGADLLVLGTRGRSRFVGLMLGSVSQGCAAHAACPVVLVNPSGVTARKGSARRPPAPPPQVS